MKWPAERVANSSPKSFGMYEDALPLIRAGKDLIHLEVGRPCFDTPLHIKEAAKKALDDGIVHYGDFQGELKLREALSRKLQAGNNLDVSPEGILVTNGLTHAGYSVCMAALDEGDEVILLEPYYPQHILKIELAGGKAVSAPLDRDNNFGINGNLIEQCITDRTRMIALVNPSNPTGRVYTREELQVLADLAIKHDLLVMSDEVYELITYDGHQHTSIASLPGMMERTFSMFAFTKAYAMDGWRLGYIATMPKYMEALLKITTSDVTHPNVFAQEGAFAAIDGPQDCLVEMLAEDCRKRDMVCERLNSMPGVSCALPQGTIYAFPDVSATGKSSEQISNELLKESHVITEGGGFYGPSGEGHLRICFGAESFERLEEAMNRMERYFNSLS